MAAKKPKRKARAKKSAKSSSESPQTPSRGTTIDIAWHSDQATVFLDPVRFKVVFCGRRWGKTLGAYTWQPTRLYARGGKLAWWVSPTYQQAYEVWRSFLTVFRSQGIILKSNKTELSFELLGDKRIVFKSADRPENLRGVGIDELVMDEFADMTPETWYEILRPTLLDSKGEAVFIGTPNGMNWATQLFYKAQSGDDPDWKAWQFSTYSNPFIDREELKKLEADTPESVVRQEIYAEPMENATGVFRNIDELSTAQPQQPIKGRRYQMGVDLAKYKDFTVIAVFDEKIQVYLERFNKIDWALQEKRIQDVAIRYNDAEVVVDSTGLGDVVYERLKRLGVRVTPFQITSSTKPELIDTLSVRCDKKELTLLDDVVQKAELKAYAYELTKGGHLKTNAPSGLHDDTVIAVALATFKEPVNAKTRVIAGRISNFRAR